MTTPPEGLDYTNAGTAMPERPVLPRPTAVSVIAAIGLFLGAAGLMCKPVMLVYALVQIPHPVFEAIRNDSFVRGWTVVGVATGWLISLLLLLASIGCLRLRDWGRSGILAYAALAIVMTLIGRTIDWRMVEPVLAPAMRRIAEQQPGSARFQLNGVRGYTVGLVLGLWYPLLILLIFTRRKVVRAFEEWTAAADAAI